MHTYVGFCSSEIGSDKHAGLILEAMMPARKTTQFLQAEWVIVWK